MGPRFKQGPTLGDDIFIGDGSQIIGRTTLGDGAIIGVTSVVISDLPAGAAAMGNPVQIGPAADQQISVAA